MRNISKIFWECFKHNPFIWLGIVSILFAVILTGVSVPERVVIQDGIPVGFLDVDKSPVSENLFQYLAEELQMDVTVSQDEGELKDLLLNANISAIITVPEKTYENMLSEGEWQIGFTTLDDYENVAYLRGYLETFESSMEVFLEACGGREEVFQKLLSDTEPAPLERVEFEESGESRERRLRCFVQMAGIYTMLSMAAGTFFIMMILNDKQYGTYMRIQLSSIKPVQYIIGIALLGILAESVLAAGITGYYFLTGKEIGISYGIFFLIFFLYGIFVTGFSLTVGLVAKNRQTALTFLMGFTTIACIWGGAWFPIPENLGVLNKAAMLFPVYWFMQVVRSAVGENSVQILPAILVLILFTVFIYLVGAVAFTRKAE